MKTGAMYALTFGVYLVFLLLLAAVIFFVDDEDTRMLGMSGVASGLMLVTMIMAVVFLRSGKTERYQEMLEERRKSEEEWEKKE